jgi:hypothetical protein
VATDGQDRLDAFAREAECLRIADEAKHKGKPAEKERSAERLECFVQA